jgi:hypothetical protein
MSNNIENFITGLITGAILGFTVWRYLEEIENQSHSLLDDPTPERVIEHLRQQWHHN